MSRILPIKITVILPRPKSTSLYRDLLYRGATAKNFHLYDGN